VLGQRSRGAGLTGQRSPVTVDVVPMPLPNDIFDHSVVAAASTSMKGIMSMSPWRGLSRLGNYS
jgi:hypothetical protein